MDNVFFDCLADTARRFSLGSDNRRPTDREMAARKNIGLCDSKRGTESYEKALEALKNLGRDKVVYDKNAGGSNFAKAPANMIRTHLSGIGDRLTDLEYGEKRFQFFHEYGYVGNCGDRAEFLKFLLASRGFNTAHVLKHADYKEKDDHAWVVVSQIRSGPPWNNVGDGTAKSLLASKSAPKVTPGLWFFLDPWLRCDNVEDRREGYYWHGYIFDPSDNAKFMTWKRLLGYTD